MRPIKASISHSALGQNLNLVKLLAPQSKVMAVVKANAYGHGLVQSAHALNAAEGFAVLGLDEAIDLREAGFTQTILLLEGVFDPQELVISASFGLDIVVHNEPQLQMLEKATLKQKLHVHLKMNSGMNRLGFTFDQYIAAFKRLQASNNVNGITLMTHFATADECLGVDQPLALFKKVTFGLNQPISLANSASILRYPQTHAEWVRPGIMLYGASPVTGTDATHFNLKAAMTLSSEIISVQTLLAGESIGYGNRFTATKKMRVGIVACGYADGYPRNAPNGTKIAVNGVITQTIGRVSMDMLYVDLTDIPQANIGSPVELWGQVIGVDAVAEASDTVGYELLCALAPRVPMQVVA